MLWGMDPRATQLADVLLHHSLDLQSGDKLVLSASDLWAMDLLQECYRMAIEDGAHVELDVMGLQMDRGRSDTGGFLHTFLSKAQDHQLSRLSEVAFKKAEWGEKFLSIINIHDDAFLGEVEPRRIGLWRTARKPLIDTIIDKTWVLTDFPTKQLADRAGMNIEDFTNFYYAACLIDYAAEALRLQALQDVLDVGKRVRIIAPGTDLTLGIDGRLAAGTNVGKRNVPDGECFLGPEETITEGTVTFELPQSYDGNEVTGIVLQFAQGKIVSASAQKGEKYLLHMLDDHEGNRRLCELGIGMNRSITRYIQNILFDEKIAGTVHMALGQAYKEERGGGKNQGTIHWDLVKDLRVLGTTVSVDDRVIIRDGEVLV